MLLCTACCARSELDYVSLPELASRSFLPYAIRPRRPCLPHQPHPFVHRARVFIDSTTLLLQFFFDCMLQSLGITFPVGVYLARAVVTLTVFRLGNSRFGEENTRGSAVSKWNMRTINIGKWSISLVQESGC